MIDYYFKGLEKKYQEIINKSDELDEYKNVINFYSEKVHILYSLIQVLEDNILNYKRRLSNLEEKDLELLSRSLENIKRVLSKIKIDDL